MATSFVSIIIPVYNYGAFIRDALESIFRQTYPTHLMEVIVVDDGSTDDTKRIVSEYRKRVRYYYQEHSGIARARNVGVQHARGEIITFLDADDVWKDRRIEKVVEQFQSKPDIGFVYHPVELINEEGAVLHKDFCKLFRYETECRGWIANQVFSGKVFCGGSSFSFKREFLNKVWPIDECIRQGIDYYITALISCLSPGEPLPDVLGSYRLHRHNTTFFRGRGGLEELAAVYHNFATMRNKVIERIQTLNLLPDNNRPDLGSIRRTQAREVLFYHVLSGKRREGIKYLTALFRNTGSFYGILWGMALSFMVLFVPSSFLMGLIRISERKSRIARR